MDVNITGEDAVLGPPVAMRFLIAAIVTMRQKIISTLIRSTDTMFPAIKLNRLYVHFVGPNKRYLRSNIIAVAVEFAEPEDVKMSSTASNVVVATQLR